MFNTRRTPVLLPCLFALACVAAATPASGFAPEVAMAIAVRVTKALPPAAHWDPSWNDATAFGVEESYKREDQDAEATASAHRYVAGRTLPDPALDAPSAAGRVVGWAPRAIADAAIELREAMTLRQAARITEAVGKVSVSAADLADPYLMSAPELVEALGVRARFSDLVEAVALQGVQAPGVTHDIDDVLGAALNLAAQSAGTRVAIESAAMAQDEAGFKRLRRERLEAALSLAQSVVVHAWREAGSPSLEGAAPLEGVAKIWPNPANGATQISFTLPKAGEARVDVFDVAGRRVWSNALGRLPAGPHEVQLEERTSRLLPAGLFLVRVRTAEHEALGRMLRLRN